MRLLFSISLIALSLVQAHCQDQSEPNDIELSAGLSYGFAPSLSIDGKSSSGNIWSIYCDLVLKESIVGRLQYSTLIPSSLDDQFNTIVTSGLGFNGSIGISVDLAEKFTSLFMGTIGYASIKKNIGFSKQQQGMQYGITVSPKYYITDRLIGNVSLRYLLGSSVQSGNKIRQSDVSFGILYAIY